VRWHNDVVMHPSSLPSRRDDSSTAKICEMPGDLWLGTSENLHEVAHTNLLIAHKVQKPESGVVTESLEEPFHTKTSLCSHNSNIYALTYSFTSNIVA
jgi:hypothetical protein